MPRRSCIYRRFFASTRGVVAIEFSFLFPILLLLLLAGIDAGRAVAISMKVRSAAYAVNAMANQYPSIDDATMTNILGASSQVLAPYSNTPVTVKLSQISIDSGGNATVVWSDGLNTTGYSAGSSIAIPSYLQTTTGSQATCASYPCYLLRGEVAYTYTPMFGHFITGPINLSDTLYVTPRSVICIQRNGTPASC
jgi:Flp pilus assembly protein TadG